MEPGNGKQQENAIIVIIYLENSNPKNVGRLDLIADVVNTPSAGIAAKTYSSSFLNSSSKYL